MKRLLIIPILLFCLAASGQGVKYYIDPAGSDLSGDGSSGNPWASLGYAAGQAFEVDDTIWVNAGTYTQSAAVELAVGVNVIGVGTESIINFTYANATWTNACLKLVSASEGTDGSQVIKNLKITGSSQTAYHGILIRCRSNVTLEDLTIENFLYNGVHFYGSAGSGEPTTYASGNNLTSCIITNNCKKAYDFSSNGTGQVRISGQDDMDVNDNTLTNTTAGAGLCGNNMDLKDGYNKRLRIYENKSYKPATNGTDWNIHIESWDGMGGNHVYNNEFWGGGMQMDIGGHFNVKGDYDYSWLVEYNFFGNTEQPTYVSGQTLSLGLMIEGNTSDVIVRYNNFKYTANGIQMNAQQYETRYYDVVGVEIYYNLFEDVGYTNRNSWIIELSSESTTVVIEDVEIDNNVIVAKSSYKAEGALFFMVECPVTDVYLRNNIIVGMTIAPIYLYYCTGQVTNLYSQNNILYTNGNSDLIKYYSSLTVSNYVNTNNILADNPDFVGGSPYSFVLQEGSPAIDAGLDVSLTEDYAGNTVPINTTPDIGAYEYGEEAPPEPPAGTVFAKDKTGNFMKDSSGNLMMIIE